MKFEIKKRSPQPVFRQLRDYIYQGIVSGKYMEGEQLPTVKEVAAFAGVSARTAYLALEELVKEGSCFKRPKKGIFVREKSPDVPERKQVFGAWARYSVQSAMYPIPKMFYAGLMSGCIQTGGNPVLISEDPGSLIKQYDLSPGFDFKGLIVMDLESFQEMISLAEKFPSKQFFFLNYRLKDFENMPPNVTAIINDDFGGAYRMIEYLAEKGLSKILLATQDVSYKTDTTYTERLRGFKTAIRDFNLELLGEVKVGHTDYQRETTRETMQLLSEYLMHGEQPDVICCINDPIAEGAYAEVQKPKFKNILVSGYDCMTHEIILQRDYPTVQVPYSEMALKAIQLMGSQEKHGQVITLAPKIVYHDKMEGNDRI